MAHQAFLFRMAHRILGCTWDADDMVQEVWLRWQRQSTADIRSPRAWLGATMTRLCIDHLRSARRQREDSYGILPESLLGESGADPKMTADAARFLPMGLALVVKALAPVERCVFLLHEVFDFSYAATATIVGKSAANCRQILRRARTHMRVKSQWRPLPDKQAHRLVSQFAAAAATGNFTGLLASMNPGAARYRGGNSRVRWRRPGPKIAMFTDQKARLPSQAVGRLEALTPVGYAADFTSRVPTHGLLPATRANAASSR